MSTDWKDRPQRTALHAGIYFLIGVTLAAAGWVSPDPRLASALWWMGFIAIAIAGAYVLCAAVDRVNARRHKETDEWFRSITEPRNVCVVDAPPYDWARERSA